MIRLLALAVVCWSSAAVAQDSRPESRGAAPAPPAAEQIFSGPQAGERTLPFRAADVTGRRAEREFDPTREAGAAPALYFFFPADVNRIIARALVTIGAAADQGKSHGLQSYFIGLAQDALAGDQRLRDVWSSLKPGTPASLSVDGLEGPGNWGLNKKCYATVVLAKDGKVVFNLASLAPSDSDYETLRQEMSKLLGVTIDARPEGLEGGRGMGGGRGASGGEGRGPASRAARAERPPRGEERPASREAGGGNRATAEADFKRIEEAVVQYRLRNATLPESLAALARKDANGFAYLREIPKDPWGREYHYSVREDGAGFTLSSLGADGAEGGDGENSDLRRERSWRGGR